MQDEDLLQAPPQHAPAHSPAALPRLRTGTAALRLDLAARAIRTSDGDEVRYDHLVLATGSRPRVPPVPGIEDRPAAGGSLAPGVTALRTIADAHRLAGLATAARRRHGRIAVLGGGVLGLEAARALAARGTAVTVVHRGGHLMDRQLDAAAGRVLAAALRATGIDVMLNAAVTRWEPGRGLRVGDDLLPCSGLLLSTGTVPETELAAAAGLRLTPSATVAVDDALTTSDPQVSAIGDCAGHPGAAEGLVQPGWEQAAVLASRLTGADRHARYRGSAAVTRLKAAGIDLTCAGDPFPDPGDPDYEVLRFEDTGRYAKLVLQDERVSGAIMLGFPDAAAGIVALYDRGACVPSDRLALLFGRALPGDSPAGTPSALPDHAIVCRCNMVTKAQLRDAWYSGAASRPALSAATRAATGCGGCARDVDAFATWLGSTDPAAPPGGPARVPDCAVDAAWPASGAQSRASPGGAGPHAVAASPVDPPDLPALPTPFTPRTTLTSKEAVFP
jgi:assimilatory nitrate reductase electron transfer subunit